MPLQSPSGALWVFNHTLLISVVQQIFIQHLLCARHWEYQRKKVCLPPSAHNLPSHGQDLVSTTELNSKVKNVQQFDKGAKTWLGMVRKRERCAQSRGGGKSISNREKKGAEDEQNGT